MIGAAVYGASSAITNCNWSEEIAGCLGGPPPPGAPSLPFAQQYWQVEPQDQGDIVGRDLNFPLLGPIGHVGIWNKGTGEIIEMLDESPALQGNTISSFRSRAQFWGSGVFPKSFPPAPICNNISTCDRLIRYSTVQYTAAVQASLWLAIGASYTTSSTIWAHPIPGRFAPELANPFAPPGTPIPYVRPVPGLFRCDVFVREVYIVAGVPRQEMTYGLGLGLTPVGMFNELFVQRRPAQGPSEPPPAGFDGLVPAWPTVDPFWPVLTL